MSEFLRLRHGTLDVQHRIAEFIHVARVFFGKKKARGVCTGSDLVDAVSYGIQLAHHAMVIGRRELLRQESVEQRAQVGFLG